MILVIDSVDFNHNFLIRLNTLYSNWSNTLKADIANVVMEELLKANNPDHGDTVAVELPITMESESIKSNEFAESAKYMIVNYPDKIKRMYFSNDGSFDLEFK